MEIHSKDKSVKIKIKELLVGRVTFVALNLNIERKEGNRIKTDRRESIQS